MKALYLLLTCIPSLVFADNHILPIEQGLTLAEINNHEGAQTIAVIEDNGQTIKGINLSQDFKSAKPPIEFYTEYGYDKIARHISQATKNDLQRYSYPQLLSPAGTGALHYAAGLNYSKHATEVGQEDQPFTFLKTVTPTREAPIPFDSNRLLDYEIEICARPLRTIKQPITDDSEFAYFLCGDFTDRAQLLKEIDLDNMQSGRGFSHAKSEPYYFPTGPYLVIPKSRKLLSNINMTLWLNGQVRQNSNTAQMIWSVKQMTEDIFSSHNTKRPTYSDKEPSWLPDRQIETTSTLLTGTPDGVIMRPPSLWYKISKGTWYVLSGAFFSTPYSPREYVVNAYTKDLFKEGTFLEKGDQLTLKADWLGTINLNIE